LLVDNLVSSLQRAANDLPRSEFCLLTQVRQAHFNLRHITADGNSHLPALEDYPEGEYPFHGLEDQAGEGIYSIKEETEGTNARYNSGGFMAYGSSLFSSGTGPVTEEMYPYLAADASHSTAEDWSLPEETRFAIGMELENSSILPSPAARDAEGNYVYNPYGTYTIKREVLNGRAVTIVYHADTSMDPNARKNALRDLYRLEGFVFEDEAFDSFFTYHLMGERETDMLPSAKLLLVQILLAQGGMPMEEVNEVTAQMTAEEIAEVVAKFYAPPEEAETEAEVSAEAEAEAAQAEAEALEAEKRAKAAEFGFDYDAYLAEMEQIAEATKEMDLLTGEYSLVTSYLTDMEEIEALPEEEPIDGPEVIARVGELLSAYHDYRLEQLAEETQEEIPGETSTQQPWEDPEEIPEQQPEETKPAAPPPMKRKRPHTKPAFQAVCHL